MQEIGYGSDAETNGRIRKINVSQLVEVTATSKLVEQIEEMVLLEPRS